MMPADWVSDPSELFHMGAGIVVIRVNLPAPILLPFGVASVICNGAEPLLEVLAHAVRKSRSLIRTGISGACRTG